MRRARQGAVSASVNSGARMDRLPIGPFHHRMLWLVGMGVFFDSFDNKLSSSVLAAMLKNGESTLALNSLFMSVTYAGLMVGAAFAGWLSDRFGRRFAYQFNLAVFGSTAVASAFAPSMEWLIVLRAIMAVGMGAEYVMGYGLITEFVPPAQRGRYLGWLGLFAGVGVFVTALVAWAIVPALGWRPMFLIGGLGALWIWWERRKLPESPRWLEKTGRAEEAEAILQDIEREAARGGALPAPAPAAPAPAPQRVSITVLFSRAVIQRTVMAIIVCITALFGSYSLTSWMPTFFVEQGLSVTTSLGYNAAMMAGYVAGPLLCVFYADRIGRRWGLVGVGVACAVLGAIYPFLTSPAQIVFCGFLLVAGAAVFLTLALGGATELFPTEYRFRGSGLAQMVARGVLIVSPFIVLSLFRPYGIAGVVVAISGMYLAVALLVALAWIETNRRSLEAVEPDASAVAGLRRP